MKNEAEANAESDKAKRDEIDTRNSAEQLVYQTETQLKEFKDIKYKSYYFLDNKFDKNLLEDFRSSNKIFSKIYFSENCCFS